MLGLGCSSGRADTVPDAITGTMTTQQQALFADQATGIWFFHIVGVDCLGRITQQVAHYEVRVGMDPGSGNVAGTVRDATSGLPIANALVEINGGALRTSSSQNGDYTFSAMIPADPDPYGVRASAPGYSTETAQATVGVGTSEIIDFDLQPTAGNSPLPFRLGHEYSVVRWATVAVNDMHYPWVSTGHRDHFGISAMGQSITRMSGAIDRFGVPYVFRAANTAFTGYTYEHPRIRGVEQPRHRRDRDRLHAPV